MQRKKNTIGTNQKKQKITTKKKKQQLTLKPKIKKIKPQTKSPNNSSQRQNIMKMRHNKISIM